MAIVYDVKGQVCKEFFGDGAHGFEWHDVVVNAMIDGDGYVNRAD